MIQQDSQTVWGYGRGMARTVARVTNTDAGFVTLGPMLFTQLPGAGVWQVDLDVDQELEEEVDPYEEGAAHTAARSAFPIWQVLRTTCPS